MKKNIILFAFLLVQILVYGQQFADVEIRRDVPCPDAVDLGGDSLVLWSTFNLGASNPEDIGVITGWADPTGELNYQAFDESQDNYLPPQACSALYGGETPPCDIQGTDLDIAKAWLGRGWMLPDISDWEWLFENCLWEIENKENGLGYKVTGPNGNSIFLPSWGDKVEIDEDGSRFLYGAYWTETSASGYIAAMDDDDLAVIKQQALFFSLPSLPKTDYIITTAARWDQLMVRPVKSK